MLWLICALAAIVLMVISVKIYFNDEAGVSRVVFVLVCLFAATYIAYVPVFFSAYGAIPGAIGNLLNVLRVVSIDADLTEQYAVITGTLGNGVWTKLYIVLLGALHVACPVLSALTAVTVLIRCFSSVQLLFANRRNRPLFVFSEINEKSRCLAKSLQGMQCDIVFADSSADSANDDAKAGRRFIFKEESISELRVRTGCHKEIYFFCLSENEDLSLSHSLQLIEKYTAAPESDQPHIHIYQFSQHQDFAVFIDSANKGSLDVQCVNEYEILIYNLLDQHPLTQMAKSGVHVLLHGLSTINIVALKAIAWCGQISGFSLRISVVGSEIGDQESELKLAVPGLFTDRYDIRFYDCKTEKEIVDIIETECADANYIIVSEENDNATMERGILLRRLFYKLDPAFAACPPIFCYIKEPAKYNLIKHLATAESNAKRKMSYDLIPFGSLDEVYTYQKLVDSQLEKLAKNVHMAYEAIFSDGEIDVTQALARYNIFEVNKRSNRANALHIRYKLHLLGLDYTDDPEAEEVKMEDYFTDESMEAMARSEHDRWMAFLETEGWTVASREAVLAYKESDISKGRHNCPLLKMHPYICEYEALKDLSMELEGKDTTIYDEALIRHIPNILGDKWKVAGKQYKLIKLR